MTRGVTRMIRYVLALALLAPADTTPGAEPAPSPPRVEAGQQVTARDQLSARLKGLAARLFNPDPAWRAPPVTSGRSR
jgi:hypothetical protein